MPKYELLTDGRAVGKLDADRSAVSAILYLDGGAAPVAARICPAATEECRRTCLVSTAGRARFSPAVLAARRRRREWLQADPAGFLAALRRDLTRLASAAARAGLPAAVRLNGGSDLDWDGIGGVWSTATALGIQCWEYTKRPALAVRLAAGGVDVTLSHSGPNAAGCRAHVAAGGRVAVVFDVGRGRPLPAAWHGLPVVDGDRTDFRWTDAAGVVVGLRAKGDARGTGRTDGQSFVVAVA